MLDAWSLRLGAWLFFISFAKIIIVDLVGLRLVASEILRTFACSLKLTSLGPEGRVIFGVFEFH